MTTNQDIMAYLKKSQEAREKEKEEDLKARAVERKEDMQKILEMIAVGVKREVNSMLKPLEEKLDSQEKVNLEMATQIITMKEELEALRQVVHRQEFPSLSDHRDHSGTAIGSCVTTGLEDSRRPSGTPWQGAADEEEVLNMCADARRVIGLTPIDQRMLELQMQSFGARDKEEAMLMEVKSFLKCEMKMRPSEIKRLDIVRIFHPSKDNWNVLYVELGSEYQVDSLFSYTREMVKKDHRVTRWIPRKMYQRFSALQTVAYNLRKCDGVKTRVKIGYCDFELSIREHGSSFWKKCQLPDNLPRIEVNGLSSSPPPGRPGRENLVENRRVVDEVAIEK